MKNIYSTTFLITVFSLCFILSYSFVLIATDNGNSSKILAKFTTNTDSSKLAMNQKPYESTFNVLQKEFEINSGKLVYADLKNMKIYLKENGEIVKQYTIVSKGKPGSYYETPVGSYQVLSKKYSHFSSLGNVYMPYAMQFYGNFFIHGIPYHTDGVRVSTEYSGGCIRLNDNDAKVIFEFVDMNTKVLISNGEEKYNNTDLGTDTTANAITSLISLENINQEKQIYWNGSKIKIKDLNGLILKNNSDAIQIVLNELGSARYEDLFIRKLDAIGINNTDLEKIENRKLIYDYVKNNKSYILDLL